MTTDQTSQWKLHRRAVEVGPMSACVKCSRGDCASCTGFDGPITTHPDSLPLCTCDHQSTGGRPVTYVTEWTEVQP